MVLCIKIINVAKAASRTLSVHLMHAGIIAAHRPCQRECAAWGRPGRDRVNGNVPIGSEGRPPGRPAARSEARHDPQLCASAHAPCGRRASWSSPLRNRLAYFRIPTPVDILPPTRHPVQSEHHPLTRQSAPVGIFPHPRPGWQHLVSNENCPQCAWAHRKPVNL